MSKKHSFRRRWPVYLVMTLICVTSIAVIVLVMGDIDTPARAKTPQTGGGIPRAIR